MFDEWAGSDGAVTFSFGGLAIIRRATCLFMMMIANFITPMNLKTMQPMNVARADERIVDLIRELQREGPL
jgi:hypothetical protein